MIGRISGRLDWRGPDHVLIDVRGVGYIVYVSVRTLAGLPGLGEAVSLDEWCATDRRCVGRHFFDRQKLVVAPHRVGGAFQ